VKCDWISRDALFQLFRHWWAVRLCIASRDGCRMHDLQPSSRARRMYRRLSLSSTHCIILLLSSGGVRSARSLSIFDWNLSAGVGAVPRVVVLLQRVGVLVAWAGTWVGRQQGWHCRHLSSHLFTFWCCNSCRDLDHAIADSSVSSSSAQLQVLVWNSVVKLLSLACMSSRASMSCSTPLLPWLVSSAHAVTKSLPDHSCETCTF